jgi:hypothetical protein
MEPRLSSEKSAGDAIRKRKRFIHARDKFGAPAHLSATLDQRSLT